MFLSFKNIGRLALAAMILGAAHSAHAQAAKPAAGAAPAAAPAEPPAELGAIVGKWTTALEGLPGGPQLGTFSAEKAGDGLKGSITSPLGEKPVDSIKVEGPKHTFAFNLDALGQSMDVAISVKVKGDTFEGDMLVGGGAMQAKLKGAKVGTQAETDLKKYVAEEIHKIVGDPILPVADAKDFLGDWTFTGESPMGGDPMQVAFSIVDVDGKASAKLGLPPPLGTHTINKLTKTAKGLNMTYSMEMMGNPMDMTVDMERSGAMLTGLIDVGGGLFQIPLEGVKKGRGFSKMTAGGKNVFVEHGRPSTSGAGYKQMSTVKDGFIWRLGSNEVTSLTTDVDMKFGDTTVKAGSYSLWAKRKGDGWNLLFNTEPTGWGTKHVASADVAEVPLTASKAAAPVELLTLTVKSDSSAPGAGVFKLAWGTEEGTAKFVLNLPPPPPPSAGPAPGAAK